MKSRNRTKRADSGATGAEDWSKIPSTTLQAFLNDGGRYSLTEITVYRDGKILDGSGDRVDLAGFKRNVAKGWIRTTLPEGATLTLLPLARLTAKEVRCGVLEAEFVKQVVDEIAKLNGRPTTLAKCRLAYERFNANPTRAARAALRKAYEAIPQHRRRYVLGDMDLKDVPIRMIVYGDQEIENWSHRTLGRAMGMNPLPTIQVKQVLNGKTRQKRSVRRSRQPPNQGVAAADHLPRPARSAARR